MKYDEIKPFINYCMSDLLKHKRAISIVRSSFIALPAYTCQSDIEKPLQVNGFYDGETRQFGIAIGKPIKNWFPILVHEYCHFLQDLEKFAPFKKLECTNFPDFDRWINGYEEYSDWDMKEVFQVTQEVEWDCERRVMEMIETHNLPIDREQYAQEANAYLMFYKAALKHRKWYTKEPYRVKSICNRLPKTLMSLSQISKPPKWFMDSVKRNCFS